MVILYLQSFCDSSSLANRHDVMKFHFDISSDTSHWRMLSTEKIAGAGEATRRPHGARPGRHDVQTVEDGFYP